MSLKSADPHDSDVLRKKIESLLSVKLLGCNAVLSGLTSCYKATRKVCLINVYRGKASPNCVL